MGIKRKCEPISSLLTKRLSTAHVIEKKKQPTPLAIYMRYIYNKPKGETLYPYSITLTSCRDSLVGIGAKRFLIMSATICCGANLRII